MVDEPGLPSLHRLMLFSLTGRSCVAAGTKQSLHLPFKGTEANISRSEAAAKLPPTMLAKGHHNSHPLSISHRTVFNALSSLQVIIQRDVARKRILDLAEMSSSHRQCFQEESICCLDRSYEQKLFLSLSYSAPSSRQRYQA